MNTTSRNLFEQTASSELQVERLGPAAVLLRRFASARETALLASLESIAAQAPFRHMITPGGFTMSVAMTNCGPFGWVTDRSGYRYSPTDPVSGQPWPSMPSVFLELAGDAAKQAGFDHFRPDACLINRYQPGARMSLHQDKDEKDVEQPIVSVSLGLPAVFLFGGFTRSSAAVRLPLEHGDVVVWGGEDRLRYHGVVPLKPGTHPLVGSYRLNLTFRKATYSLAASVP